MNMILLVTFCLFGFSGTEAQKISIGRCDSTAQPLANFNLESYLGLWYEISRTNNFFESGECVTARYSSNATTGLVDVSNSAVSKGVRKTINGTAKLEKDGRAALIVSFPSAIFKPTSSNYWVLDTDYSKYSLVYYCLNIGPLRFITLWKLSRTPSLAKEVDAHLNEVINNIKGISPSDLRVTDFSEKSCYVAP